MVAIVEIDDVVFHCGHASCGEIFEKSLGALAGREQAFCPRCGTPAPVGGETRLLAATRAAAALSMAKVTG